MSYTRDKLRFDIAIGAMNDSNDECDGCHGFLPLWEDPDNYEMGTDLSYCESCWGVRPIPIRTITRRAQ